jgi:hypothetical protein
MRITPKDRLDDRRQHFQHHGRSDIEGGEDVCACECRILSKGKDMARTRRTLAVGASPLVRPYVIEYEAGHGSRDASAFVYCAVREWAQRVLISRTQKQESS